MLTLSNGSVFTDADLWNLKQAIAGAQPPIPLAPVSVPPVPASTLTIQNLADIAWPQGGNTPRLPIPNFGDGVLVIRFVTPAASTRQPSLQVSQIGGTPQVFRLATLATQPGVVAMKPGASGPILASAVSQSPVFRLVVGTGRVGLIGLAPSTTYYLNVVNRDGYSGPSNCTGKCGVNIDFTN
jgi:hypothetical protein